MKFRCAKTPSGSDGYNKMYSSDKGWIYYDQDSGNEKQQWTVLKVRGSDQDNIVREGDTVRIRNRFFDRSYLKNYDGTWVSSENEAADEWTIRLDRQ